MIIKLNEIKMILNYIILMDNFVKINIKFYKIINLI